jgi:hypothetical protein
MPGTLTARHIEQILADVWLFEHQGHAVQASFTFDEPEHVLLVGVGGTNTTTIEWDTLSDLLHADDRGSDLVDLEALRRYLGAIIDNPPAYGAKRLDHG